MGGGFDIYVFEMDNQFLFKHYFESSAVFDALSEHYVSEAYRFEMPAEDYEAVADTLRDHGYEPTVVEDPEPFCVVIGQYEPHADILKESVANWTRREHRFFLMKDPFAVEQALERGAERVVDSAFEAGI